MRQEGTLLDVTFIVSDNVEVLKIRAHKLLLASVSPYFKSMFTRWTRDEYQINGVDPNIFKLLIDSIYGIDILTNDWYILLNILILVKYFCIDTINIGSYVELINVPSECILNYIVGLNHLYTEGFPIEIVDRIAGKLNSNVDLSFLTDEIIHLIFLSEKYQPSNETTTFKIINRLVEQYGRDSDFYKLVCFGSIPVHIRNLYPQYILDKYLNNKRRDSSDSNYLVSSLNDFLRIQLFKYGNDFDLANKNGYDSMIVRICLPVRKREYQTPNGIKTFGPETLIKGSHPTQSRRAVFDTRYDDVLYNDIIEITQYELERDFDVGKGRVFIKIKEWKHFL